MSALPAIPKRTTSAFAFIGVILYLGSTYLNILEKDSATLGIWGGILLIVIATIFQIIIWIWLDSD